MQKEGYNPIIIRFQRCAAVVIIIHRHYEIVVRKHNDTYVSYMNIYEAGTYSVDNTWEIEIRAFNPRMSVANCLTYYIFILLFLTLRAFIFFFFHGPINNGNTDVSKEQNVHAACDV